MFLGKRLGEANLFAELSFGRLSGLPLTVTFVARNHGPAAARCRITGLGLCLGLPWRWDLYMQSSLGRNVDMREWTLVVCTSSRHVESARLIVVELALVTSLALSFEVISANECRVGDHLSAFLGVLASLAYAGLQG